MFSLYRTTNQLFPTTSLLPSIAFAPKQNVPKVDQKSSLLDSCYKDKLEALQDELQILSLISTHIYPSKEIPLEDEMEQAYEPYSPIEYETTSVLRKRRTKMNKHKWKKARKEQRFLRKKLKK